MDVPRVRFGAVLEWAVAAGLLLAAAGLGSRALVELRRVPAMTPVIAEGLPVPDAPVGVPSGSVRVPILLLSSGVELRVGRSAAESAQVLDRAWQVGSDAFEQVDGSERLIRRYDDGSTRFTLVLHPPEVPDARIVAIYVAR